MASGQMQSLRRQWINQYPGGRLRLFLHPLQWRLSCHYTLPQTASESRQRGLRLTTQLGGRRSALKSRGRKGDGLSRRPPAGTKTVPSPPLQTGRHKRRPKITARHKAGRQLRADSGTWVTETAQTPFHVPAASSPKSSPEHQIRT